MVVIVRDTEVATWSKFILQPSCNLQPLKTIKMKQEDRIQQEIFTFHWNKFKEDRKLFFHVPNEANIMPFKRVEDVLSGVLPEVLLKKAMRALNSAFDVARILSKRKQIGVVSGVSDMILLKPKGKYHGLIMEIKTEKGKPSDKQLEFIEAAENETYYTCIVYSVEEGKKHLTHYYSL